MSDYNFKNGDVIEYCGVFFKVLNNNGGFGDVVECDIDGNLYESSLVFNNFPWKSDEEESVLVSSE